MGAIHDTLMGGALLQVRIATGILAAAVALACAASPLRAGDSIEEKEAASLAVQGVIYGLPLVLMDVTRQKMTNVVRPGFRGAPLNQFAHAPVIPDASFKAVVRPNVDTLYSSAWLDLSKEPVVLSVPDTHGRFYLMSMLDAWTNVFASPGKRTTGTGAGHFAITGPRWKGTLPEGVVEMRSPTNTVWIIGRTQTNGPADYGAVHAVQRQYLLAPLSAFGKPFTPLPGSIDPRVDMRTPPVDQVVQMDAPAFFQQLAVLMKANPPPASDGPLLADLARIGLVPGQDFRLAGLDPRVVRGLQGAVAKAIDEVNAAARMKGRPSNGWLESTSQGDYGHDYLQRAVKALIGLGANLRADSMNPVAFTDTEGNPLTGANRYVIHFSKGQTPPANAFWSVTLYDSRSFLAANPLNRYSLSSWMPLQYNDDQSLDLYVQKDSPGVSREANWLPAPQGAFNLTMRIYWPRPEALDGTWAPPGLTRAK